jgi:lipoprotein-anchoring transpeptidase ErfK/SrfK
VERKELLSVLNLYHNIGGWVMRSLNFARSGILFAIAASVISTTALAGSSAKPTSITNLFESAATDSVGATVDSEEFRRQVVDYSTRELAGTVIVDTPNTFLYLVLGGGKAIRYGIGVGREGFTWSGVQMVTKKTEWPDWTPPTEMIARQPYLPRFTAGGPGNPMGARAMYLGGTIYRIHGTNDPTTIGKHVSSGCIRLTNEDVSDLYDRIPVGAKIVVLPNIIAPAVSIARRTVAPRAAL